MRPLGAYLGLAVMLGWGLVAAWLFRALGPRRGTVIAVIGGNLLVPCLVFNVVDESRLQFTQATAIGLAVAIGIVAGDPRALARMRPDWLDLPMLSYVAYPLCGLIANGRSASWDVGDMILQRGLGTLLPYAAARRYLGDAEGARQVGIAIVVATLLFVPVVVHEAVVGPRWYLGSLLYGSTPQEGMVNRLGGWRPEGFFLNGLTLATWMALAAVVACWLWIGRGWRPPRGPSWWPALVLVLASIGCRGVYGYLTLCLGLATVAVTWALRTRWAIALLLLAATVYMGMRVTGEWDARVLTRIAEVTGRAGTVDFRLRAEDRILARVLMRHPIVGFGVQIWHYPIVDEPLDLWPDGQWLIVLWSGGLAGLALHLSALFLIPVGLALSVPPTWPSGGRGAASAGAVAGAPILGLALFAALCMIDGLHNHSAFTPRALVAGSLVGIVVNRRRGMTPPHEAARSNREGPSQPRPRPRPPSETSLIPIVTATACILYVFGHGPVAGHETVKLIGGLGAALLFAAAGGVGAWASTLVPLNRLAIFAGLFAALGVSFNLALHPGSRPAASADILQGLALCGLVVACWRRSVGAHAWGDAVLVVLPLLAHFVLRPIVPDFPGVQYLFARPAVEQSLFPLFPWLTMAALGALAIGQAASASGASALLLATATATALALGSRTDPGGPVKFPMDLPYALLSCTAVGTAFTLAHGLKRLAGPRRAAEWLGRNWLLFFYLHFAVAFALGRSGIGTSAVVWATLAAGSLGATWLVSKASAPFSGVFRSPAAWLVPLALTAVAGGWPGLPPPAVAALAGCAGVLFAAYHGTLAYLIVNLPSIGSWPSRFPMWSRSSPSADASRRAGQAERVRGHEWERERDRGRERTRPDPPDTAAIGVGRALVRLALLLALLAVPEVVGFLFGSGHARPTTAGTPPSSRRDSTPTALPDR